MPFASCGRPFAGSLASLSTRWASPGPCLVLGSAIFSDANLHVIVESVGPDCEEETTSAAGLLRRLVIYN